MKEGFTKTQNLFMKSNQRMSSISKSIASKEVAVQQINKKRKIHSNSILNELKLSQKISHKDMFTKQQHTLRTLQKLRQNSLKTLKNRNSSSDLTTLNFLQQSMFQISRVSRFADDNKDLSSNLNEDLQKKDNQQQDSIFFRKDTYQPNLKQKTSIEEKPLNQTNKKTNIFQNRKSQLTVNKIKKKNVKSLKNNKLLSQINNKIREIDIISKTFDQVNQNYNSDYNLNLTNYLPKKQKKVNPLQQFQSKLTLRKNMITKRKNSLKKNTIIDYRYKAFPKRYKTQIDKENCQQKYEGLWNQDARRLKNYISGGYSIEKEQFSDFCDLQDYHKLKKSFKTFEQIYSNIKQDKDNPIGKMIRTDRKNPTILEVVCAIEKQHEINQQNHNKK